MNFWRCFGKKKKINNQNQIKSRKVFFFFKKQLGAASLKINSLIINFFKKFKQTYPNCHPKVT